MLVEGIVKGKSPDSEEESGLFRYLNNLAKPG